MVEATEITNSRLDTFWGRDNVRVVRGRRLLFGLVLGGSLATNGYLLHARNRGRASVAAPLSSLGRLPQHPAQSPQLHPQQALPVPDTIAKLDRATLEERVRAAEAKVDALLPLFEKFESAAGGAENEPRVRAVIDGVFGVGGSDESPYELECRGDLCRFQSDRPRREWEQPLQSELVGLARDMMVSSDAVYFEVDDPARTAAKQYVIGIANALWMSPALAACKRRVTAPGIVNVTLRIVARHVEVDMSGELADTPVGGCIRSVVEELVHATPLPDEVTDLPFNTLPVRVP